MTLNRDVQNVGEFRCVRDFVSLHRPVSDARHGEQDDGLERNGRIPPCLIAGMGQRVGVGSSVKSAVADYAGERNDLIML